MRRKPVALQDVEVLRHEQLTGLVDVPARHPGIS